jgi:hypothetical protein
MANGGRCSQGTGPQYREMSHLRQRAIYYNLMCIKVSLDVSTALASEDRTARLTLLIDPRKKALFEQLCADEDATPSQVVRRLIRQYIEERTGKPWAPGEGRPASRRRSAER